MYEGKQVQIFEKDSISKTESEKGYPISEPIKRNNLSMVDKLLSDPHNDFQTNLKDPHNDFQIDFNLKLHYVGLRANSENNIVEFLNLRKNDTVLIFAKLNNN